MIDIPGFIKEIEEGNMAQASAILSRYTNLPAICGRVCPQEKQCEMVCCLGQSKKFKPVAIGKLERLVADWALQQPIVPLDITHDKAGWRSSVPVLGADGSR